MGIGTGRFDDFDETQRKHQSGAVPQIRFGRMLGRHLNLSVNYQGWMVEFDRYGEAEIEDAKIRRSLQDLTLGLAWFPGNQEGPWGGLYIRAGAGPGWAGTTIVPVIEDEAQEHGERHDDWGTGYFAEAGYEFWISNNTALGLIASYNYFDIDGDIVKTAWFTSANLTLSLYF
jgi:opacity protein-like surface antigen